MRIALWIASPPTCMVRTPRALVTATAPGLGFFNLGERSSRSDRPERLYPAAAHADVPVVEVDRRVAMAGNEQQLLAERRQGRLWRFTFYPAVLVGGVSVLQSIFFPDQRHSGVHAGSLEAGIDDRAVRRAAHDGREDEERVLEARQRRGPFVLRVVDVHERVRAALDLVPGARLDLQHERAA